MTNDYTQVRLDQQLHYEHALTGYSQALLSVAENEESQQQVLNQALEHLRAGAQASRSYLFRNFQDPDLGPCMGMLAEACSPEILPQLNNPANRKFPWSQLPQDMFNSLQSGEPYGGPVERVFASTPHLMENFLQQLNPLLSVICFPIFFNELWWGFVGFDDCEHAREWDAQEILMLRTAAEIIGNTVQRWQAEEKLRQTLANLEQRVQERTIEYAQANAELRHEIHERQRFQNELEERLEIEGALAKISARLLSPLDLPSAIHETLVNLGQIMQASRVVFIQVPTGTTDIAREAIEWHSPNIPPLADDLNRYLKSAYPWFRNQLGGNKSVYIKDLSNLPGEALPERQLLIGSGVDALLLTPLIMDNQLEGVISISNPKLPKAKILGNTRLVEVVAGMLGSLLRREALLNTLEEKVAERTHELSAFFDMAMLAGEAHEISDIMQPALVNIMEIIASEAAAIHLYDEHQHTMKLVAQRGVPSEQLSQLQTLHMDEPMTEWINNSSDAVWPSSTTKLPVTLDLPDFQSTTHVSLRARGKIQGLLSCYRLSDAPFNPYQVFFLNAIGEQLGMAVENYRLRLKAEEVATIQERQRLARELHDAVSQSLYSLALFARSGRDALEVGDQVKLSDSLEQVEANSLAALKEMRLLLYQLRSLALEEGGLVQAIESRFDLVERRTGINASVEMDENIDLNGRVEHELFRLVTEALNNALKHAGASQVSVTIRSENGLVVLNIQDNGRSFDPGQTFAGMGLQNMRERVSTLGGYIDFSSQPGIGTRIRVEIPQSQAPEGED